MRQQRELSREQRRGMLSDWQVCFCTMAASVVTDKPPFVPPNGSILLKTWRTHEQTSTKSQRNTCMHRCISTPDVTTQHTERRSGHSGLLSLPLALSWKYLPAWISITSAACPPSPRIRGELKGKRWKHQSEWRQWDRAAGKILKGRCGCSNVLTNSRKFPLNPVCWVFCACGGLRRRRRRWRKEEEAEEEERKPANYYLKLGGKKDLGQVLGKAQRNKAQWCVFYWQRQVHHLKCGVL